LCKESQQINLSKIIKKFFFFFFSFSRNLQGFQDFRAQNLNPRPPYASRTMLDSITVFTKGGTVLYHNNCSSAKQVRHHGVASLLPQAQENWNQGQGREVVNSFISSVLLGEGGTNSKNKNKLVGGTGINEGSRPRHREILYLGSNQTPIVVEWLDGNNNCSTPALVGGGGDARGLPTRNWIILASYPEVAMRKLHDVDILLSSLIRRYALYYEHYCKTQVVQEVDCRFVPL
jgi:hypothetical protein